MGRLNASLTKHINAQSEIDISNGREWSKKSSSPVLSYAEGKAAASLTRGAYSQYVSTAKWRPACA